MDSLIVLKSKMPTLQDEEEIARVSPPQLEQEEERCDHYEAEEKEDEEEEEEDARAAVAMRRSNGHGLATRSMTSTGKWRLGMRVEREIDRVWFPATIVACGHDGTFELEYDDEEHHREADVDQDEIRLLDETSCSGRGPVVPVKTTLSTPQKEKLQREQALLLTADYDPNKVPTVVLHQRGESHSVSGYIINGLENNIAAGNGLRGIRWLRVNTG